MPIVDGREDHGAVHEPIQGGVQLVRRRRVQFGPAKPRRARRRAGRRPPAGGRPRSPRRGQPPAGEGPPQGAPAP
eukprot:7512936-Lingulodinium_polyedra.AAC.1